jgi:hypothetical protein
VSVQNLTTFANNSAVDRSDYVSPAQKKIGISGRFDLMALVMSISSSITITHFYFTSFMLCLTAEKEKKSLWTS